MNQIQTLLDEFQAIAAHPRVQLERLRAQGKKVIGCFPYYVPEELVEAAGMVPFAIWGAEGTIKAAREYFPSFYCTIAQMGLELALTGKLDGLSGVIMSSMCDTLRPLTQNFKAAVPDVPMLFLAHPQNRRLACGIQYTVSEFTRVKAGLEEIAGTAVTNEKLFAAFDTYNKSRAARRAFVRLAGAHPEAVSPSARGAVLKSAGFMAKTEHTAKLNALNSALEALPVVPWKGVKVVTSGILADSQNLLRIFEDAQVAVAADDVACESRAIRVDVPEEKDPLLALARQFAAQDDDPLLYDPALGKRPDHVVRLVRESGAQGAVILMMQFCDPEEMEYPALKKALDQAGIPSVVVGYDQQMRDFGQAKTSIQAFVDILQ